MSEVIYSQKAYGGTRLGTCDGIDRGLYGCWVSTAAMMLTHWAGPGDGAHPDWQADPGQLDEILTLRAIRGEPGGYVNGCDGYPGLLHDLHPEVLFEGRLDYASVPADLSKLSHASDYELEQIIELDGFYIGLGYRTHYVRLWDWDGTTLTIANPWTGQNEPHDGSWAQRAITAIETYRLPGFRPAWAPPAPPPLPPPPPEPPPPPPPPPVPYTREIPAVLKDLVPWETSPSFAAASDYPTLAAMGFKAVLIRCGNGDGTGAKDQDFVTAWKERSVAARQAGLLPIPWNYWYGPREGVTGDVAVYLEACAHYTAQLTEPDAPCWFVDAEDPDLPGLGDALATLSALAKLPVVLSCPGDPVTYGLRWQWGPIVGAVAALAPQFYTADWQSAMTIDRALQELQAVGATAPLLPALDEISGVARARQAGWQGCSWWCISATPADQLKLARQTWAPPPPPPLPPDVVALDEDLVAANRALSEAVKAIADARRAFSALYPPASP